jgi:hypothetical protein
MIIAGLLLVLAVTNVNLDVISVPLSNSARLVLAPAARGEAKREGTVTRINVEVDRLAAPSTHGAALNTYVVWAISPEGLLDNIGELEMKGGKGQLSATTRLTQFGLLITAEPHYMVDRPSSAVAYRSQSPETDPRRKSMQVEVGAYDYGQLKPITGGAVHSSVIQARAAYQIAQAVGAERLAPMEFRNAQVALGAMEELINRAAPLDILWPSANEVIGWSQRAAAYARAQR